jgi:hypothetical protein
MPQQQAAAKQCQEHERPHILQQQATLEAGTPCSQQRLRPAAGWCMAAAKQLCYLCQLL